MHGFCSTSQILYYHENNNGLQQAMVAFIILLPNLMAKEIKAFPQPRLDCDCFSHASESSCENHQEFVSCGESDGSLHRFLLTKRFFFRPFCAGTSGALSSISAVRLMKLISTLASAASA